MGELLNCAECGTLFLSNGSTVCQACSIKIKGYIKKVDNFLRSNPGANISEISAGTDISEKTLRHFVNEGVLVMNNNAIKYSRCILCGAKILEGKICSACRKKMTK